MPITASRGDDLNLPEPQGETMTVNLSPLVRLVIYIIGSVGTLVAGYLFVKGVIGREEVGLWGGFVALAFGLAGLNTPTVRK